MSKTLTMLRPTARRLSDGVNDPGSSGPPNLDDLAAYTWTDKLPRESDNQHLPVLPNSGMVRRRLLVPPDGPDNPGFSSFVLPTVYFGKNGSVITLPLAAIAGGPKNTGASIFDAMTPDAAFLDALDGGRIMLGRTLIETDVIGNAGNQGYQGRWLLDAVPFVSNAASSEFIGGELMVCVSVQLEGIYAGVPYSVTPLFAADAARLAAVFAKYQRFRLKVYAPLNTSGLPGQSPADQLAAYTSMMGTLTGSGIDAVFGGQFTDDDATVAAMKTDIKTFFGIP